MPYMPRRHNRRAPVDLPVTVHADGMKFDCRAVDLSPDGISLDRTPGLTVHDGRPFYWIHIPLGDHGIRALARPTWTAGRRQGFRFIMVSDEARLTMAEHMDVVERLWGRALH